MAENQQSIGDSWNRRMRLIRFRRKRENFSFWQEFKIIPPLAGLGGVCAVSGGAGRRGFDQLIRRGWRSVPARLAGASVLQSLALAGISTGVALLLQAGFSWLRM
jgi:hypothetical protein